MDALKYVTSKDIRRHLEKIGYEFSPVETAWLIWQCENITFEERLAAWQKIIDTLPDVSITYGEYKSLHGFLQSYILLQKQSCHPLYDDVTRKFYHIWWDVMDEIKLPVPFLKGDIVCEPNNGSECPVVWIEDGFLVKETEVYSFDNASGICRNYRPFLPTMEYYPIVTPTDKDRVL